MLEQSGLVKSFYTNWIDSGLFARVEIEDNTTGTPVAVGSPLVMVEWKPGIYLANFTPDPDIAYLYTSRVYTDGTFTTVDTNYAADVGDFSCVNFASLGGGGQTFESAVLLSAENESDLLSADESEDAILTGEDDC